MAHKKTVVVLITGVLFVCCVAQIDLRQLAAEELEQGAPVAAEPSPTTARPTSRTARRATNSDRARPRAVAVVPASNSNGTKLPSGSNQRVVGYVVMADPDAANLQPLPVQSDDQNPMANADARRTLTESAQGVAPDESCRDCWQDSSGGNCFCNPMSRYWVRADYLEWWTSSAHLPPLVTTGNVNDAFPGALGQPGTQILFGNSNVNWQGRPGWRITAGRWLGCGQNWGIEGDYFELGGNSTVFNDSSTSTGSPLIARPFFNVNPDPTTGLPPGQDAELVAEPGQLQGNITVQATDYFQSAGAHLRHPLFCGACCDEGGCDDACGSCGRSYQVDLIAGYRYYRLTDQVFIHENLQNSANNGNGPPLFGVAFDVSDSFRAENAFHGGEIGLETKSFRGPWSLGLSAKVAMGNNHQSVFIAGSTTRTRGGTSITDVGGLLAQTTNIGLHTRDDFVMIPELGLDLGYQLTCRMRLYVGYDILYWASVARAGDQIDLNVDSALIPGGGRADTPKLPFPAFAFQGSNFWAQGLHTGFEFRF